MVENDNRQQGKVLTRCTWSCACTLPASQLVWRETRPGLIVHEAVCATHVTDAVERYRYRTDRPPIPPPVGLSVPHPPAGR